MHLTGVHGPGRLGSAHQTTRTHHTLQMLQNCFYSWAKQPKVSQLKKQASNQEQVLAL